MTTLALIFTTHPIIAWTGAVIVAVPVAMFAWGAWAVLREMFFGGDLTKKKR